MILLAKLGPILVKYSLNLFANNVLRRIVDDVKDANQFTVVIDGTQDCSGLEQESIFLRYVDRNLEVQETLVYIIHQTPPQVQH